jgi:hypothetical protein
LPPRPKASRQRNSETAKQLDRLRAEGCAEVQGYLFSPPRPASENRKFASGRTVKSTCRRLIEVHGPRAGTREYDAHFQASAEIGRLWSAIERSVRTIHDARGVRDFGCLAA